jgi:hypothetical protein
MTASRRGRGDAGASLFLVIGFMAIIGGTLGGLIPFITTSVRATSSIDVTRNRQYAADAAIEEAAAKVRGLGGDGPAKAACGGPYQKTTNGIAIRVECENHFTFVYASSQVLEQRNVRFWACPDTGTACSDSTITSRAQINYEMPGASVTRTYIQSWSVNR